MEFEKIPHNFGSDVPQVASKKLGKKVIEIGFCQITYES